MRRVFILVLALLLAPAVFGAMQETVVTIHEDNLVEEHITLTLQLTERYEAVEFVTQRAPLTVLYDGEYTTETIENGTLITLYRPLAVGKNVVTFTLLYDDLVIDEGKTRVFSSQFEPIETIDLTITLPEGAILADAESPVSPAPDEITTDGRHVVLHWRERETLGVIVLYDLLGSFPWLVVIAIGSITILTALGVLVWKRRGNRSALLETLTPDELRLVELLREGITKQNDLCERAEFSKSKMSKVVRRLEEKGAIRKQPWHKTNRISLAPAWK